VAYMNFPRAWLSGNRIGRVHPPVTRSRLPPIAIETASGYFYPSASSDFHAAPWRECRKNYRGARARSATPV
jgi:hypothetical protein